MSVFKYKVLHVLHIVKKKLEAVLQVAALSIHIP